MMDSEEKRYETIAQVIERVKELAQSEETPEKEEVELLKSLFYKLHFQEREQKLKTYLDEGGDPEKYVIQADDTEETAINRLKIYDTQTAPVIEYYRSRGELKVSPNADAPIEENYAVLEKTLGL